MNARYRVTVRFANGDPAQSSVFGLDAEHAMSDLTSRLAELTAALGEGDRFIVQREHDLSPEATS